MKSISLTFQVHQPFQLKKYRFFDIGNDSYYYDDFENERKIRHSAENYYLPANEILLSLMRKFPGRLKIAFSISGIALDQFYLYAPEVIESFQRMADTGNVEFLGETYSHSLASLQDKDEFLRQVKSHQKKIEDYFGQSPAVFKNTELLYSDEIGESIAQLGFKAVLTEGAKHILRWRSPNYLYSHPRNPALKLLLKNHRLTEDISFRLANSDWPGFTSISGNYLSVLTNLPLQEKIINLYMNYELVGQGQRRGNGIFNFLKSFPATVLELTNYNFMTPSEIIEHYAPVAEIQIPETIVRQNENDGDLSTWIGNELQQEALQKLYSLTEKIEKCTNGELLKDWQYLQSTDHFYYMCSKFFSDHHKSAINPYNNPYEAFMNYMNILDDFVKRLNHSSKQATRRFTFSKLQELVKE